MNIFKVLLSVSLFPITLLVISPASAAQRDVVKKATLTVEDFLPFPGAPVDACQVEVHIKCGDWHRDCTFEGDVEEDDCTGSEEDYNGDLSECDYSVTVTHTN